MNARLQKQLLESAKAFLRSRCWKRLPSDAPFLIRLEDEAHPLVCSSIDGDRGDISVALMRGSNAFDVSARLSFDDDDEALEDDIEALLIGWMPWGDLDGKSRAFLERAGVRMKRDALAPSFTVKASGSEPRTASSSDAKAIIRSLAGIAAAEESGQLSIAPFKNRGAPVIQLEIGGSLQRPTVEARTVPPPASPDPDAQNLLLRPGLDSLSGLDQTWHAGVLPLPSLLPYEVGVPCAVVIARPGKDRLEFEWRMVKRGSVQTLSDLLCAIMFGETPDSDGEGRPAQIQLSDGDLLAPLGRALEELEVEIGCEGLPSKAVELVSDVHNKAIEYTLENPKSGDYATWRAIQLRMVSERNAVVNPHPGVLTMGEYFGSADAVPLILSAMIEQGPLESWAEANFCDAPSPEDGKTAVDLALERTDWTAPQRTLLAARRDALLSLFRVVSVEFPTLTVEDHFTGETFTVHDVSIAEKQMVGMYLGLRLFRLPGIILCCVASPIIEEKNLSLVLELLEEMELSLEPDVVHEEFRREPEAFGSIFAMFAPAYARARALQEQRRAEEEYA